MYEIPRISDLEEETPTGFAIPEITITGDQVEVVEEGVDTSLVGIGDDRAIEELVPVVEVTIPESRVEVLSRQVDAAIAAAPTLEFTEDGSYPMVQVAGAVRFAEEIKNGSLDEIINVEPPEVIPPNIVTAPDLDSFGELVDISIEKLTETWPEDERPDPDVMEIIAEDIKIHERVHAEEAVLAGLEATYALTFVQGEDGLSVGPSVLLSGSATREQWTNVFTRAAETEGPLDLPLAPSYLDDLYAIPSETAKSYAEVDIEERPAPLYSDKEVGPSLADDATSLETRDIPTVQRPSGGLRDEIRRLGDAIEERDGIDAADLLSEGYETALPLLRSDMSSTEIAEQLGFAGKDTPTQVSGLARRVLSALTREAPPEVVDSLRTEPSVGATLQGLAKQAGVALTEIRAQHGVSLLSLERLFLGKERANDQAFGAVVSTLVKRGVLSQDDAGKLVNKYFAERRTRKTSEEQ